MRAILRYHGAVERDPAVAAWLAGHAGALGELARTWFERLRAAGPGVRELMHDRLATACLHDAPFAYVGVFKAHVNIGFYQGAFLHDPSHLLQGEGKRMRHVSLRPGQPCDVAALDALVAAAYADIAARLAPAR